MCENVAQIRFCTCETGDKAVHNKNSRRNKAGDVKSYRWSLHKIAGLSQDTMDGLLMEPDNAFNRELTATRILAEMNARNCFDFEYEPQEGDSFSVSESSSGKFMSFLFEQGNWKIGSPNLFYTPGHEV